MLLSESLKIFQLLLVSPYGDLHLLLIYENVNIFNGCIVIRHQSVSFQKQPKLYSGILNFEIFEFELLDLVFLQFDRFLLEFHLGRVCTKLLLDGCIGHGIGFGLVILIDMHMIFP
ncbi:hypothetical protein ABW21_db0202496 [Orbilia brochopaga]|nr:hypothetical protein ABW21_db0202496 [Drechslerella brochopaga]